MAIEMTTFEINRWNSDDQAVAALADAHWDCFFAEPKYSNAKGERSRKHQNWHTALVTLAHAAKHIKGHTAAYRNVA